MQTNRTKEHRLADVRDGGGAVEAPPRPTAAGRITHPATPLTVWVSALCKTSEAQGAHLRAALGQGVAK